MTLQTAEKVSAQCERNAWPSWPWPLCVLRQSLTGMCRAPLQPSILGRDADWSQAGRCILAARQTMHDTDCPFRDFCSVATSRILHVRYLSFCVAFVLWDCWAWSGSEN